MVVVMKKLTYAAMLTENEASEEFREGVIKCFRALIEELSSCGIEGCSCGEINGLPALVEAGDNRNMNSARNYLGGEGKCLVSFLRSQSASAFVGHWFSLLLKVSCDFWELSLLLIFEFVLNIVLFLYYNYKRLRIMRFLEDIEGVRRFGLKHF